MAKLTANVLLSREGESVVLLAGEELPEWAVDLVGEHVLDGADPEAEGKAKPRTTRK